jgi:excisionase family DNA binding protein
MFQAGKQAVRPKDLLVKTDASHPLMTTPEAAAALRHSPETLRDWVARSRGPIKPVRIGRRVFWKREEVERLLAGGSK